MKECGIKSETSVNYYKMITDPKEVSEDALEKIGYGKVATEDHKYGWTWTVSDTKDDGTTLVLSIEIDPPPYTPIRIMPDLFKIFDMNLHENVLDPFLNARTEEQTNDVMANYKSRFRFDSIDTKDISQMS